MSFILFSFSFIIDIIFFTTNNNESFGLILQNLKLICIIGTIETYLGFWGERLNFGITIAKIQPKVWERRCKRRKEKMLNFGNVDTEIPLPSSAAWTCLLCTRVWSARRKKKKKGNCGNAIAEIGEKKKKKKNLVIVAMAMPKMKKKKKVVPKYLKE